MPTPRDGQQSNGQRYLVTRSGLTPRLRTLVPMLDLAAPIRFIFPNAPVRPITINGGMEMRGWYDIDPEVLLAGAKDIQASAAATAPLSRQK